MKISRNGIIAYLRFFFIVVVIFFSIVGCETSWIPQINQPTGEPNPTVTVTVKLSPAPVKTLRATPTAIIAPTGTFTPSLPEDITWKMLGEINFDRALTDLKRLTGEEQICPTNGCNTIKNRMTGGEGLRWAKDYMFQELTKLDYSVSLQEWSSIGYTDQNLIASKLGLVYPEERIYFVAHIDGYFPAADDNASGVVDILELARVLSSYTFERTIVLFFSTGEENGTLGVDSYLSHLSSAELATIKYVIDIDMVGYDGNNDRVMELFHGGHAPSIALAQIIKEQIQAYQINLVPLVVPGCG